MVGCQFRVAFMRMGIRNAGNGRVNSTQVTG